MEPLVLDCEEPWFSKLANGTKRVEGRKARAKYRLLKRGDTLLFKCKGEQKQFYARVNHVDAFKSLDEYLEKVTIAEALPGVATLEEARQIYYQWSTPEQIAQEGFLAIWIDLPHHLLQSVLKNEL